MAIDKDVKRLVRRRMAATGERYTEARAGLLGRDPSPPPRDEDPVSERDPLHRRWIELLADPDQSRGAFELLEALPADTLRPLAVAGLAHEHARVRRRCAQLLDDLSFTDESLAALQASLDDTDPKVRRAAMHSLACQRCKPDGCALDIRPLFERMVHDPSAKVRSAVVGPLTYQDLGPWAADLLAGVAAADPSPKLRAEAAAGIARRDAQWASNDERLGLPDDLRRKTERHRDKWVAVADGTIIGVGNFAGALRRIIKGKGYEGRARVYWVGPDRPGAAGAADAG
jgi:HEAT repeat protein